MTVILRVGQPHNEQQFSLSWKMGSCYGPQNNIKYTYSNSTYLDRCCLSPGVYSLVCRNDIEPFGWGNSFIEILGQRYCDDFVGYKGLRKVIVSGMYK